MPIVDTFYLPLGEPAGPGYALPMKFFISIALLASLSAQAREKTESATTICPYNLEEATCLVLACNQAQVQAQDVAKKDCGGKSPKVDFWKSGITGIPIVLKLAGQARCQYRLRYECP